MDANTPVNANSPISKISAFDFEHRIKNLHSISLYIASINSLFNFHSTFWARGQANDGKLYYIYFDSLLLATWRVFF